MRSLAPSHAVLQPSQQEQLQPEQRPLQFRNLALIYPGKDILERIRRHGDDNAPLPRYINAMFDEDNNRDSPIAMDQGIRVMIAQDDTGVSLDRLLFDSHHMATTTSSAPLASRPTSPTQARRSNGYLRHPPSKESKDDEESKGRKGCQKDSPAFFGQASHARRAPAYVSLADARNDVQLPAENTKEEMDSWLDCVFGKGHLRYKGDNTKLHLVQRRPCDPDHSPWVREAQLSASALYPQRDGPPRTSTSTDSTTPMRRALLISRTFSVPLDHHPQQSRQADKKSATDTTKPRSKSNHATPIFAVAILVPLQNTAFSDDGCQSHADDAPAGPQQLAMNHWHTLTRALDALEAAAMGPIRHQLGVEIEAMANKYSKSLPVSSRKIRLQQKALQASRHMISLSESVSSRIARSFHVLDVVTKSGWNIWRDELRDSSRSDKGIDSARINFIQRALTATLSSNLSWMNVFAPIHLQTRLRHEARLQQDKYTDSQNRTVVTTADHNRARQIIYLLSKFLPITKSPEQFARSPTDGKTSGRVSALTQGLKAVNQQPGLVKAGEHFVLHGPPVSLGPPVFNLPVPSSPGTSPVRHELDINGPRSRSPSKSSLQRMKTRIDIQGKGTPAMPIASAPGSSWTTPAVSPDARPSSSAGAQENLMRQLQRNNSALSETSTESSSFWNSLRSNSWNWGFRRESGATSISESGVAIGASQRGDPPASILKTGKTSYGRGTGKKLVRMVEEADELQSHHTTDDGRKDSGVPTPTTLQPASKAAPLAFSQMLEYTFDSTASVIDVKPLGANPLVKSRKVPVTGHNFPRTQNEPLQRTDLSLSRSGSNVTYNRVAGYLDRLHPDFALQAVKPYRYLEDDIRRSMQGERSPTHGFMASEHSLLPLERWVRVCSTMLIDADTMAVKCVTLRRRIRYTLTTPDGVPESHVPNASSSAIKVTKSEDMDSVKRTYRRDDAGSKIDWMDKKIVPSESGSSSDRGSGEDSMTSSYEHITVGSAGTAFKQSLGPEVEERRPVAGSTGTPFKHTFVLDNKTMPKMGDAAPLSGMDNMKGSSKKIGKQVPVIGDDLTAFIDENAKSNNRPKPQPPASSTRRVAIRDREGKITGWKETDEDNFEDPGLHDLPTSFVNPRREKPMPIIHEHILEEVFDEETLVKPDQYIVNLVERMLASSDTRSAVPSRAGSTHERTRSRSNSICGSGLAELQSESKRIVQDSLEGLVTSVASERQSPSRPSGNFFGFRRGGNASSEASMLHQSILKWLNEV